MSYDRDELCSIGERFQAEQLLRWSEHLLQHARQDLERLKSRGVTESMLRDIQAARDEVIALAPDARQAPGDLPLTKARRNAIEGALAWRQEVLRMACAIFDSDPDRLAAFRPGVKLSRSLPKLGAEMAHLSGALRQVHTALGGDALLERGEEVRRRLDEAQLRQSEARAQVPKTLSDLWFAQGVLYTRARFVLRMARAEFADDSREGRYGYDVLRQARTTPESERPRLLRQPVGERVR